MQKNTFVKNLVAQLCDAMPENVHALKKDFEKNCQSILAKAFSKFDLVTREEFETQTKVLARSRKKLDELEKHLKELEAALNSKHRQK
ncbi:MAG: hypothetical protein A3E85_04025 [Gammaproteobacteria bacterium RIFCSPHIGHO2_12_FULL_45_12]|nr:MAG: hypothetical protein A3E85_04025 [Gammaproteobacteria bacterium RIFCSPHIGHO2_12_FULL_45_12]